MPTVVLAAASRGPAAALAPQVAFYRRGGRTGPHDHDAAAKARVAQSIAELLGWDFVGELEPARRSGRRIYLVPTDTLPTFADARRLGVRGPGDLFGGVVPQPFVATKLISHPLVRPGSPAPRGWSAACGERMKSAVLPGYSVFTSGDARIAAQRLLQHGAIRLKDPAGVGGVGQWVVRRLDELEPHLERFGVERLARHGLVLERNLQDVTTYSVGCVEVGGLRAAYYGTQNLTPNRQGHEVYGGSRLVVSRGGLEDLLCAALEPGAHRAVERALVFHRTAMGCFKGLIASRCNYDVAQGIADDGQPCCGVLEQSWRIGGASGAEAAALHAFRADAALARVSASTCERYGDDVRPPPGAWVLYDGPDSHGGRLVKYVEVKRDVDT